MSAFRLNSSVEMFLFIVLITLLSTGVLSSIRVGPTNSLMKTGGTVLLKCITNSNNCSNIDWGKVEGSQSPLTIFHYARGMLNPDRYPGSRYKVSPVGGCNLEISQLELSDSGKFVCSETLDGKEDTKNAIVVVFEVDSRPCTSNVSPDISEGDAYGISCSAKIRPDLITPLIVDLKWLNGSSTLAAVSSNSTYVVLETVTVVSPYAGKAMAAPVLGFQCNIAIRNEALTNKLEICSLPKQNVSYSVRNITFDPDKKEFKPMEKVKCVAKGFPYPTYEWKSMKTGDVVTTTDVLVISNGSLPGDHYMCIAKNEVKRITNSISLNVTVVSGGGGGGGADSSTGLIVGIVIGILCLVIVVVIVSILLYKKYARNYSANNGKSETLVPLNKTPEAAPAKPPRANSNQIYRPQSEEVQYAQVAADNNPHVRPSKPSNPSSTIYASVASA